MDGSFENKTELQILSRRVILFPKLPLARVLNPCEGSCDLESIIPK